MTASIFGDWIRDIPYFAFREVEVEGIQVVVARSGWSHQGGFEIYLEGAEHGRKLWNIVKEAGKPYGIALARPTASSALRAACCPTGPTPVPTRTRSNSVWDASLIWTWNQTS